MIDQLGIESKCPGVGTHIQNDGWSTQPGGVDATVLMVLEDLLHQPLVRSGQPEGILSCRRIHRGRDELVGWWRGRWSGASEAIRSHMVTSAAFGHVGKLGTGPHEPPPQIAVLLLVAVLAQRLIEESSSR